MRVEIARLHKELGTTMIYVTHDQTEAMTLADRIVVLRAGNIEQIGRPLDLYDDPDNQFVAGFVGSPKMNFLGATVVGRGRSRRDGRARRPARRRASRSRSPGRSRSRAARSWSACGPSISATPAQGDADLQVKVDVVEHLGSTSFLYARTLAGEDVVIERRCGGRSATPTEITVSITAGPTCSTRPGCGFARPPDPIC